MSAPEEAFTDAPVKNMGGRPPKLEANQKTFDFLSGLGAIQATKPEVAAVMRVTLPTLRKFFNENPEALAAYESGMGTGKASLRRRQWAMAEKNPQMAIWLGKNWLNQSDRSKHEHTGKGGAPLAVMDLSKLSPEELDAYEALCLKLGAEAEHDDADEDEAAVGEPGDVPSGDAGGDPGGEGSPGYGEEPI